MVVSLIISELYPDVISEDLDYEYKAQLNSENPIKWAKTIVGYANGKGGIMFVGVSNDGEALLNCRDGNVKSPTALIKLSNV